MLTTILLYAGVLPLVIAAVVAFVARQLRACPHATWACSVAIGVIAAQVGLKFAAQFGLKSGAGLAAAVRTFVQPMEAMEWLPIILLLALGVSLLTISAPPHLWQLAFALAALLIIAVPLRLLSGNVAQQWSINEKRAYLTLLASTFGFIWLLLAIDGKEQSSVGRLLFVIIVAIGTAAVLALSGALINGRPCGAVAAALTGCALACTLPGATGSASATRRLTFDGFPGAAGIIAFSLVSLIILGHFFASLNGVNAVLLLASLAAAGAPFPSAIVARPLWQQLAARAATCLPPLAIAILRVLN